jgi:hypothetical protein
VAQTRTFPISGEESFELEIRAVLHELGAALDAHRLLLVHNGGRITVHQPATATPDEEDGDERQGQTGSPAKSRKRPSRGKGPARGPRPARAITWVGSDGLRSTYESQMTRLAEAYPTVQTFPDDNGMWLLAKSSIISGLERKATFLIAVPYQSGIWPRAWGFWTGSQEVRWIGPRHTNFYDGSICAFSPSDRAWSEGGDLVTLVDLYTVWAVRHLYLEVFGRWPGKQYTLIDGDPRLQAYYRRVQCRDDELCACGSETRQYADCCKQSDLERDFVQLASLFLKEIPGGFNTRCPPAPVIAFVEGRSAIPKMADIYRPTASPGRTVLAA